jgi:hypothetical protein
MTSKAVSKAKILSADEIVGNKRSARATDSPKNRFSQLQTDALR